MRNKFFDILVTLIGLEGMHACMKITEIIIREIVIEVSFCFINVYLNRHTEYLPGYYHQYRLGS